MTLASRSSSTLRRVGLGIVAVLGLLLGVIAVASPHAAFAASCPTTSHCYSVAIRNNGGDNWIGSKTRIAREFLSAGTVGAAGRHINSESWFILDNGTFVEAGLRNGRDGSAPGVISDSDCDCVAYDLFWSDTDSSGMQHRHIIQHTTPNAGATDIYEFTRKPYATNQWLMNLNGNTIGTSTVVSGWTSHRRDMGGEYANSATCASSGGSAATFNMTNWLMNTSYTYSTWSPSLTIVDNYCGGINGAYYGTPGTWSWNKP